MTELLQQAFDEVSKLSQVEQNEVANWILAELDSEQKWDTALTSSLGALEQMADEALKEYERK